MKIILKGNPLSTQHLYGQKGKIRYMKTEAKLLKQLYDYQILAQYRGKPLEDDLILEIKLYFKDKRRRDVDNWHKLSLDAMSGKIYNDDSQIQKMVVEKFIDKLNPRIEILINKLNPEQFKKEEAEDLKRSAKIAKEVEKEFLDLLKN